MRVGYGWRRGVCVLIPLLAGLLLAPTASATVPLGGGAGIMVDGTLCTLTTIGHDKSGDLVGFTAASCGGPGSPVAALGGGPIGSVVAVEPSLLKYGVIKFDPAEVAPTDNFAGFAINGIGPDPVFLGNRHARTARTPAFSAA